MDKSFFAGLEGSRFRNEGLTGHGTLDEFQFGQEMRGLLLKRFASTPFRMGCPCPFNGYLSNLKAPFHRHSFFSLDLRLSRLPESLFRLNEPERGTSFDYWIFFLS